VVPVASLSYTRIVLHPSDSKFAGSNPVLDICEGIFVFVCVILW
jgi:hypothetical protein